MYFQILKIVLWRRNGTSRRTLEFNSGVVNVISGASKTGKSAVIPIVDYCLGSNRCAIPVGVIREACEWFGVLVETPEGQKLFARREPGDQQQTGDMFVLEGNRVEIPERIISRNCNTEVAKAILDRVASLSNLGFEPETDNAYRARPSFRDLMAFVFQPQNIVANPDILFFKADTTEHREKLRTIFPYVLDAVTADDLALRWELDRLQRLLRRKENELRAAASYLEVWKGEAQAWIRQAVDLGLLPATDELPQEWPDILDRLKFVAGLDSRSARPSVASLEVSLRRLSELRTRETAVAEDVSESRQRLNEIVRLNQSSDAFVGALRVQRDRLSLSKWIRDRSTEESSAMSVLGDKGQPMIDTLVDRLEGIEMELRSHPTMSGRLDKEQLRLRQGLETNLGDLAAIRQEIAILERDSAEAREAAYGYDRIERFLGRLQQALLLYDRDDANAELRQQINDIEAEIGRIRKLTSEAETARKVANATRTVEGVASAIAPQLDVEWPDAAIKLVINDLTIKIVRGNRDDYLWEIGSGANWLAYHVALSLALQRFFLALPHHPVPSFVVYDQPSQVYFPRRMADGADFVPTDWSDEDVVAVRKVFAAIAAEVLRAKGRLQAIVLDHADSAVWGGIEGVNLVEEWRDGSQKLVPPDWLPNANITP